MKPYFRNLGLGLAAVGILLFILCPDILGWMKKPIDFYADETAVTDIKKGDRVSITVDTVYDYFATETTVDENTGATVSSNGTTYYYLIPGYVTEGGGYRLYYFGIKANTKSETDLQKAISKIMKATQNGEQPAPITLDAYCVKMDKELTGLMYDYFRDLDYDEELIQTYVLPYYLRELKVDTAKSMFTASLILFVIGATLFVTMFISIKKEKKRIETQTEVIINGVSYPKDMFYPVHQQALRRHPSAVPMLMELTGISQEEATEVIRKWGNYYYY